jgi:hypothetical protein
MKRLYVGEMAEKANGEFVSINALISGEMKAAEIPLAPGVDLEAIKAGDKDPLEVVVEIPAGKSKRGWNYLPQTIKRIVDQVASKTAAGFLGHQDPEKINNEFLTPVTHWVGALWDAKNNKGYFRGVVDASAPDLKRWIRSKRVTQVSIYGIPKLQQTAGETQVVDYDLLSIDWTPLHRAGMPTKIVATGEMDEIVKTNDEVNGEMDGSYEELKAALREAVQKLYPNVYVYILKVYPEYVIAEVDDSSGTKYYQIAYGVVDGKVELGEPKEVQRVVQFIPVMGEMNIGKGGEVMSWKQIVEQLKAKLASKEVTLQQIVGEMGLDAKTAAGAADQKWLNDVLKAVEDRGKIAEVLGISGEMDVLQTVQQTVDTLSKVKEKLGVSGEMDVVAVAEEAAKAMQEKRQQEFEKTVNEVVAEKVSGEMAQKVVRKMLKVTEGMTKEQIAGELDQVLSDETVKSLLGQVYTDNPTMIVVNGKDNQSSSSLRVKRQLI